MCGRGAGAKDHRYLVANQIGRQFRETVISPSRPEKFDGNVLVDDVAGLVEAAAECCNQIYIWIG
jgi:hypothetical protein